MKRLLAALSLALAAPAASQTTPPLFYAPTNVAVEHDGMAEVRIIRATASSAPSTFHITTDDASVSSTAIWPADIKTKVDITVTIQPGQVIATAMIPLAYHNSFQDTKEAIVSIQPVSNAQIDRTVVPLVIYDGNISHTDAWKPAPVLVENGFAQLRADDNGWPKSDGCCGAPIDYTNLYPSVVAGEVVRLIGTGYAYKSNRKVWHVVKLNNSTKDAWVYEDELLPVQAAVWQGDPTVAH